MNEADDPVLNNRYTTVCLFEFFRSTPRFRRLDVVKYARSVLPLNRALEIKDIQAHYFSNLAFIESQNLLINTSISS